MRVVALGGGHGLAASLSALRRLETDLTGVVTVADMRFLPNPFWIDELRPLTGLDEAVRDYVRKQPRSEEFLDRYEGLVALLTDGFLHEDKHFLTIAIGCTGGRHRSVAMAEAFAERLRAHDVRTLVVHRDLGRE